MRLHDPTRSNSAAEFQTIASSVSTSSIVIGVGALLGTLPS